MKRKNLIISTLLITVFLIATPLAANAAGLGNLKILSALGQPLRAEIDLLAIPKDEIDLVTARIAPPEAYKQAQIERQEGLGAVRFSIERRPNGEPVLKISSVQAFNEPFLQLLIQMDWPTGRLTREYTILLDPPGFQEASAAPVIRSPVTKSEPAVQPRSDVIAPTDQPGTSEKTAKALTKSQKRAVDKALAEAKRQSKKPAKDEPILRAEPARTLTPAEQTFPRFDGEQESVVAAAEQPPAPITRAPAATPSQQQEYLVQKGDTLSKVARNLQVEGYSLEQMMVALYETNQSAFDGKNMNRIKTGRTLSVPDKAALDASSANQAAAVKEIRAHTADWNAYREKLAGAVAEQKPVKEEIKSEVSGKLTAKAEDKVATPQEPNKDVLKLSKGETAGKGDAGKGSGAESKLLKEKLAAAQDEAVAKEKALKEANSRVAELDKNIKDMQSLLELKNKQLAELEKQAKAKPAAPAVAPTKIPEPAKVETQPVVAEPVPTPVPEQRPLVQAQPDPVPEQPPTVQIPPVPVPTQTPPVQAAPAKIKPVPPPEPETSFMDTVLSNPLYLGGGAAVIVGALFAGLWALGRRRKKSLASFEDSILTGGDLKTNTVFGNTAGGQIDTGDTSFLTDFSQAGMGAIDTNDVDPIAEAEVYMAYGRDAQAEEILKEAMSKDPQRHEVQLKLLEIYAGRKNTAAFETLAAELYAATSGQGPVWKKAAEFGRGLDPSNPLYAALESADGQSDGMNVAPTAAAIGGVSAVAKDLDFSLDLDTQGGMTPAKNPAQKGSHDIDDAMGGVLDLDLDTVMGLTSAEKPSGTGSRPSPETNTKEVAALDFDFDTIIPQAVEKKTEQPPVMTDLGLDNLNFDAPSASVTERVAGQAAVKPVEEDTLALDFDFNMDQAPSAAPANGKIRTQEPVMPELDLSGINLNMDDARSPKADSDTLSLEDSTTLVGDSSVWEEATTKLDLARAYLEMGDKDGAREILQEVVGEGGPEQQAEANKMLVALT